MAKPSFDCAAAKSKWKLLICGNDDLAALDMQEDTLLRRARAKAIDERRQLVHVPPPAEGLAARRVAGGPVMRKAHANAAILLRQARKLRPPVAVVA